MSLALGRWQGWGRIVGGRYALTERIGEGGLGVVWLALDRDTERTVAIKELRLPASISESAEDVVHQRIRREVSAAKALAGHPNVITILDEFWDDGRPWVVMEYVPGESLQHLIEREFRISPWRAARIGLDVLGALDAAHDAEILHRDVKPSNILLAEDGRAVLTDFGIAQLQNASALTETGIVVGSPGYIAPERLNGESASRVSDLWSLGATLYAAVEGHMPYQRDTTLATLSAVISEPVPPPRHAGPLEPVLMGLLGKDPAWRMASDEAEAALAELLAASSSDAPTIEGLELGAQIGSSTWRAHDLAGDEVVVKLVPKDSPLVEAARTLRRRPLSHVVRVHDVGEIRGGLAYIVMEYADGGSLGRRMASGSVKAIGLIAKVARQVSALNETGVHYTVLDPGRILLQSASACGEVIRLPIPDPDSTGDDPLDDVAALTELVEFWPGAARTFGLQGLPDAAAFAEALEAQLRSGRHQAHGSLNPSFGVPRQHGDAPPTADLPTGPTGSAGPDGRRRDPEMGAARLPKGHTEPVRLPDSSAPPGDREKPKRARPGPRPQRPSTVHDHPLPTMPRTRRRPRVPFWRLGFRRRQARDSRAESLDFWTPPDPTYALYSPLREEFRYVHEPLRVGDAAIPLLGNEPLIQALQERLVNSVGGAFLVTGFRGVGKSTLIEQTLDEIKRSHPRGRRVLPVVLSVARPLETERLLFAIIRRVFEELLEAGVLDELPAETRHSLVLAYMRTSLSFKETRADATERTANMEFAPAKLAHGMLGPIGMAIPKAGMSTKRSRSLATEAAFLAYSETDVEHDMMRIIRMLSALPETPRGRWRRREPLDLQLVVVLDEVDKLTALQDGLDKVEKLLGGIKNVVTMRGAHYLVVAGPDLHDQVLRDSGRGNSIYESIFAWQMYVPCSWSAPRRLLEGLCLPSVTSNGVLEEFDAYLRFKSRGVLRRLLQELNSFVVWEDARRPYLRIESRYNDAISFYAGLERALDAFFVATDRQVPPTPLSRDRWRLGAYYVMDWILRREGRAFTSADVIQEDEDFDPMLRVSQAGVELLLEHLAGQGVLTLVREPTRATSTLISDVAEAQRPSYKLEDSLLDRLFGILAHNEYERAEVDTSRALPGRTAPIETLANDRYELWRLIGEGGTSSVYEGRDTLLRRPVAVKMLRTALRTDPRARSRFLREATIAGAVHHPNVVDVYEVVTTADEPGGRYAIVMELIAGLTLDQTITRNGPLPARQVAYLGITLAGALDYLAGKGLARLDLKPHNIVMSSARGPVIIDLGIAKIVENAQAWLIGSDEPPEIADPATQTGIVVGTPAYLSPEQARGEEIDIRSDIYALGLVLCTCLAGRHPYQQLDQVAVMARAMTGGLDTSGLPCSPELRAVLDHATEPDRARRYERPSGLLAALRDTPEGSAITPPPR